MTHLTQSFSDVFADCSHYLFTSLIEAFGVRSGTALRLGATGPAIRNINECNGRNVSFCCSLKHWAWETVSWESNVVLVVYLWIYLNSIY